MQDTIYALATARGRAGVSVVRLSGPLARDVAERLAGPLPNARQSYLRCLTWQGDSVDQALVLRFDPGASFTGEPVAEFHLHGSVAVVQRLFQVLAGMPGLRPADAGEFTRRALENGCMDLAQVEGLADLIDAETEAQRRQAERVLSGAIGRKVAVWRDKLLHAAALIEATIDFADEEVPVDVTPEVGALIDDLLAGLRAEVAGSQGAERLREGYEVAIIGAPNVGKSTLLNALSGREAALTSEYAGTTRDVIEVRMDLRGLPVTLLDTAGIRDAADPVEQMGIDLTRRRAESADIRVMLVDDAAELPALPLRAGDILRLSRADLRGPGVVAVSGKTGEGLDSLLDEIASALLRRVPQDGLLIRERHRIAVEAAIRSLENARDRLKAGGAMMEIVAADLRSATTALSGLVGGIGVEDLLGEIFSRFCIGK